MTRHLSRRDLLALGGLAVGATVASSFAAESTPKSTASFKYCLNTSTIMGQKLSLVQQIEVVAKAGYDAIEPWIRDIETYAKEGNSLPDLKKRIADLGLTVENAIGFAAWVVDNDSQRQKGLEQSKRDMDLVSQIGGKRVAAPPIGATDQPNLNLLAAAERYRALAEIGQQFGILPQIEIWGHSKCLSKLGEAALVATESGFPQGCILADVYHMYKGNSRYSGLRLLSSTALQTIHLNDYPADPPRATITDGHRVYPGDGVAPLSSILKDLRAVNPHCILSLELFNRDYWKLDPLVVAKTGLEKMQSAVAQIA
ncbi:MAG TPA: sugar phosphate isomerase/epimerase family protein [Tepidisphaeraceae bacterium]|nr:sugar phosphate isomerase/epimerase family protein [Tepidisphaeraceae bacterium]